MNQSRFYLGWSLLLIGFSGPAFAILNANPVSPSDPLAQSTVSYHRLTMGEHMASCTGIIVAPDLVLEAAHCVRPLGGGVAEDLNEHRVFFGTDGSKPSEIRGAEVVSVMPKVPGTQISTDVALLRIRGGLPKGYKPVTIAWGQTLTAQKASSVNVLGYGWTNTTGGLLRKGIMNVNATPPKLEAPLDVSKKVHLVPATQSPTKPGEPAKLLGGAVKGDSGGGVFITTPEGLQLIGVLSMASASGNTFAEPLQNFEAWLRPYISASQPTSEPASSNEEEPISTSALDAETPH